MKHGNRECKICGTPGDFYERYETPPSWYCVKHWPGRNPDYQKPSVLMSRNERRRLEKQARKAK